MRRVEGDQLRPNLRKLLKFERISNSVLIDRCFEERKQWTNVKMRWIIQTVLRCFLKGEIKSKKWFEWIGLKLETDAWWREGKMGTWTQTLRLLQATRRTLRNGDPKT